MAKFPVNKAMARGQNENCPGSPFHKLMPNQHLLLSILHEYITSAVMTTLSREARAGRTGWTGWGLV